MSINIRGGSQVSISPPAEVIIDHTNDSIRLGDGTSFIGSKTICGEVGLNVFPMDIPTTPEIINTVMAVADVEVAQAVPSNTEMFSVKIRDGAAKLRLGFAVGSTGTAYFELNRGTVYQSPTHEAGSLSTIYLRANHAPVTAEFIFWKCS